jgi:hypothetical protein
VLFLRSWGTAAGSTPVESGVHGGDEVIDGDASISVPIER